MRRPVLEARWNSAKQDDFKNFYLSSSLVPGEDNLNTLYLYNFVRGQKKNIPGLDRTNKILISVYVSDTGSVDPSPNKITLPIGGGVVSNNDVNATGGWVETGVYSASFAYTGSAKTIFPVWHTGSTEYHTGSSISVKTFEAGEEYNTKRYATKIVNLKANYSKDERARFRLFIREKDWCPTIYTEANASASNSVIEKVYYKLSRAADDFTIFNYGTGSTQHTLLSYDKNGSYFDLDMSMLEPGFQYKLKFLYDIYGDLVEPKEEFKFRVE